MKKSVSEDGVIMKPVPMCACGRGLVSNYIQNSSAGRKFHNVKSCCGKCKAEKEKETRAESKRKSLLQEKVCRFCGSTGEMYISSLGKTDICLECYPKFRSKVVNSFAKTDSHREKQRKKSTETWKNATEEQRKIHRDHTSAAVKQQFIDDPDYASRRSKKQVEAVSKIPNYYEEQGAIRAKTWESKTKEEKEEHSKKVSEGKRKSS